MGEEEKQLVDNIFNRDYSQLIKKMNSDKKSVDINKYGLPPIR